jgi:uncharacterized membrane protein YgcG
MDDEQVTYFAETDSRNKRLRFGIKARDRSRHVYVIGKTGMGKSTLLENLAIQDIQNGNGIAFIDPHGKTAELLLEYVPEGRIKDVLYFAPFDLDYPVSFNVMEDVGPDKRHLVANGMMSAFKKIWVDAWSARMEYILNNILLALLEYPDSTLLGVNRMLADKDYRNKVVSNISDPSVKSFWVDEFAKYGERYMQEAGAAIQNKIGQFVSNPLIRNIIGQPKSTFDIRHMMDEKKIIIVNLSKGRMGEANANLLGGMLITKLYLGAMSRADVAERDLKNLPNFYLFVDEFQNFANESFADILSEARKYKLNLTIAHQYIEQMTEEVKAAVFGNVGSMVTFRVGAYDAEALEKEFAPVFTMEDIVNLDKFQIYLRLMIDGVGSQPFSANTINTPPTPVPNFVPEIIDTSRSQFARPRPGVEDEIKDWHRPIEEVEKDKKNAGKDGGRSGNYENGSGRNGGGFNSGGNGGMHASKSRSDSSNGNGRSEGRNFDSKPRNSSSTQSLQSNHSSQQENRSEERSQPKRGMNESLERKNNFVKKEDEVHNPFKKALTHGSDEEKEKAHLERELELRKAISLNFLKKEEPKAGVAGGDKKDKKGVTQESLSDLRSALQSVLTQANIGIGPETKILEKFEVEAGEVRPLENFEVKSQERKFEEKKRRQENSSEKTQQTQQTQQTNQTNHVSQNRQVQEIPEKELRDILSIED